MVERERGTESPGGESQSRKEEHGEREELPRGGRRTLFARRLAVAVLLWKLLVLLWLGIVVAVAVVVVVCRRAWVSWSSGSAREGQSAPSSSSGASSSICSSSSFMTSSSSLSEPAPVGLAVSRRTSTRGGGGGPATILVEADGVGVVVGLEGGVHLAMAGSSRRARERWGRTRAHVAPLLWLAVAAPGPRGGGTP